MALVSAAVKRGARPSEVHDHELDLPCPRHRRRRLRRAAARRRQRWPRPRAPAFAASSTTGPTSKAARRSRPTPSIEAAARAAGLEYRFLPVAPQLPVARKRSPRFAELLRRAAAADARCSAARGARSTRLYQAAPSRALHARPRPRVAASGGLRDNTRPRPRAGFLESARFAATAWLERVARRRRVAALLRLSRLIDALNEWLGRWLVWLVLAAVLISAGNAIVRKAFNIELERLPRDPVVPVRRGVPAGAPATRCCASEHVQDRRRLRPLLQAHADLDRRSIGIWCSSFSAVVCIDHRARLAAVHPRLRQRARCRQNAGGLIRWPVFALMPLGFAAAAASRASPS